MLYAKKNNRFLKKIRIGFKSKDGEYKINPDPDTLMENDSKIFVLGTQEQIENLLSILI